MIGPSFRVSPQEREIISEIAHRAVLANIKANGPKAYDHQFAEMDITAVHANGNPLRLQALLEADDFNFCHDVFGIYRHLDRDTGKLKDCFRPRFSVPASD